MTAITLRRRNTPQNNVIEESEENRVRKFVARAYLEPGLATVKPVMTADDCVICLEEPKAGRPDAELVVNMLTVSRNAAVETPRGEANGQCEKEKGSFRGAAGLGTPRESLCAERAQYQLRYPNLSG